MLYSISARATWHIPRKKKRQYALQGETTHCLKSIQRTTSLLINNIRPSSLVHVFSPFFIIDLNNSLANYVIKCLSIVALVLYKCTNK